MAHVGEEIRYLLGDLVAQLNQFLWAPRNLRYFAKRVWMVAFYLGCVYNALDSAKSAWRVQHHDVRDHEIPFWEHMLIGFRHPSSRTYSPMPMQYLCKSNS